MPEVPKKTKSEPKSSPITKKSNLASKEHEALLQWLIEDLGNVCDIQFGRSEDWFEESSAKAIKDFHEENTSLLKALERGSGDESLPPDYRSACGAKLKWARAFLKKVGTPPLPDYDSASRPVVMKWNAQQQIFTQEGYVNGRGVDPKPAGFVDLQVLLSIPNDFEVSCVDRVSSNLGTKEHASHTDGTESVANLQIHAPAWSFKDYEGRHYHRAWFDVWAELPPIGELLQHLKRLRDLNPVYYDHNPPNSYGHVETSVVLVVPAINESLQAIIEHEGFSVLSKARYESDQQ